MIKFILGILVAGITFYYVGLNEGYDMGLLDKQSNDIIRGVVTCVYTKNLTKNKCYGRVK